MTLAARIERTTNDLQRLHDAYQAVWEEAATDLSTQPQARTHGRVASGKPASQEPPAGDRNARTTCIRVMRALVDAYQPLAGGPLRPWDNHQLGQRWTEPVVDCAVTDDETVVCMVRDRVEWGPDAHDLILRLPPPGEARAACETLTAAIEYAHSQGRVHAVSDALRAVRYAFDLLEAAGEWEGTAEPPICADPNCVNDCERAGRRWRTLCSRHRKAQQRDQAA